MNDNMQIVQCAHTKICLSSELADDIPPSSKCDANGHVYSIVVSKVDFTFFIFRSFSTHACGKAASDAFAHVTGWWCVYYILYYMAYAHKKYRSR